MCIKHFFIDYLSFTIRDCVWIYRGADTILSVSNAKTGFVNFWSVHQSFLYRIFMFQIIHLQKILEGHCLNKNGLTAPLYILLLVWLLLADPLWSKEHFIWVENKLVGNIGLYFLSVIFDFLFLRSEAVVIKWNKSLRSFITFCKSPQLNNTWKLN